MVKKESWNSAVWTLDCNLFVSLKPIWWLMTSTLKNETGQDRRKDAHAVKVRTVSWKRTLVICKFTQRHVFFCVPI